MSGRETEKESEEGRSPRAAALGKVVVRRRAVVRALVSVLLEMRVAGWPGRGAPVTGVTCHHHMTESIVAHSAVRRPQTA